MRRRDFIMLLGGTTASGPKLTALSVAGLSEESYPSRPMTLIVHSAAGGSIDLVNRLFAEKVSATLGQRINQEFRPGGGATIGATAVARAQPEGYTIGFLGSSATCSTISMKRSVRCRSRRPD